MVTHDILPAIRQLVRDESSPVREALASDIMGLAPLYGREGTQEHLLELFLLLLRDETPEVRLNVMGKLNQVTSVFSLDQLAQHLLPALIELAEDRQWRVRLAAQAHIPHLAQELGVDFFNERILPICISWLGDCVFTIRESATVNFKNIIRVFGVPWAQHALIPRIHTQSVHKNYLYRTVTLTLISSLAEVFPATEIQKDFIPVVFNLSNDTISNIRINSIKTITGLIPRLQPEYVNSTILPFLNEKLRTERDRDVIFFTNRALQVAGNN
jgi:serine/threonine-protein phosphatase 2A regulatory subunit A